MLKPEKPFKDSGHLISPVGTDLYRNIFKDILYELSRFDLKTL